MQFDYYGKGENNQNLIHGGIYRAKRKIDKEFSLYRASKTGRLFAMWPVDENGNRCAREGGYQLPGDMDFE
jgi:hypothetical protein